MKIVLFYLATHYSPEMCLTGIEIIIYTSHMCVLPLSLEQYYGNPAAELDP